MKKILFCFLILSSVLLFSQKILPETQKYKQIGLVWGLLKYHHPDVSNGNYDWDLEFIKLSEKLDAVKNQEEMNDFLLGFVSKYKADKLKPKKINSEKLFVKNSDYSWINATIFGKDLTKILTEIKDNSNIHNYYASTDNLAKILVFKNEKGFANFDYSLKSNRMLLLFSFWNAIQYYDVNKYLMDVNWLDNLDSSITDFINSSSLLDFEIAKSKLIAKLNDTHADHYSKVIGGARFKYWPVFMVKTVNDSLVVNKIYNKELADKDGLELGDVIVKIEGKGILETFKDKISPILSTSNSNSLKRWGRRILQNDKDSLNVEIVKKNGVRLTKFIHLYENFQLNQAVALETKQEKKWYSINPQITYVNLDQITGEELSEAFELSKDTKGLILDLRNNTHKIRESEITKHIYPKREEFVKVLFPLENNPSLGLYDGDAALKIIADPFKTGRKNADYYKGKIVLLVGRWTQSRGEYVGMEIQGSPNCITIGEQTAGSVMNTVEYMMPDKTKTVFTGLGGFYPNGENVQRKGLRIDHYVKESAKNYDSELYIKEAINLIEK